MLTIHQNNESFDISIDEQTIFSWELMGMDTTDTELSRK